MLYAEVLTKRLLETMDVVVAALAPAIGHRISRIADFQFGDRGFGVMDFGHGFFLRVRLNSLRL
jgi:hypothetical protein